MEKKNIVAAVENKKEEMELLYNPLAKYSTKQLKEELKRRKQVQ